MMHLRRIALFAAAPVALAAFVAGAGSSGSCPLCASALEAMFGAPTHAAAPGDEMPAIAPGDGATGTRATGSNGAAGANGGTTTPPPGSGAPVEVEPRGLFKAKVVDLEGREVKLARFAGKPLIIDVWATWCLPCRDLRPHVKRVAEEFRDSVNVIAVSVDREGPKKVKRFLGEEANVAHEFMSTSDFAAAVKPVDRGIIPMLIFVNAEGTIEHVEYGAIGYEPLKERTARLARRQ